ncbi:MAG: methyltransferase domain-containing protein [Alphaproteobacteria bacterium]|nr:methyltransferase domain-containing protein [Alphaproteobacteria bacterium]
MQDHFAKVAGVYREMRTTDEEPILHIRDQLGGRPAVTAADIGCGAGRYDLLLFRHIPDLRLACLDVSREMLAELSRHLARNGIHDFETINANVEEMAFEDESLDCVFTFNAVHHFDFPLFLAKAGRAIRKDGLIFIYTRTPDQNAGSVWGRHFPGFREKETRLYRLEEVEGWIGETGRLRMISAKTFRYARTSSLERLLEQARSRHYSTFSLYGEAEFEKACQTFGDAVRRRFGDPAEVAWHDQNILLQIGRTDA